MNFLDYYNFTKSHVTNQDDLFFQCWRHAGCEACLKSTYPCSWCATSQTCVPNERFRWPFGILAPIGDDSICPLSWRERWEMRAKPFSCRCSTMTFMSVVIAVISTLAGVLLLWLLKLLIVRLVYKWRQRKPDWWKVHRRVRFKQLLMWRNHSEQQNSDLQTPERTPLLA